MLIKHMQKTDVNKALGFISFAFHWEDLKRRMAYVTNILRFYFGSFRKTVYREGYPRTFVGQSVSTV